MVMAPSPGLAPHHFEAALDVGPPHLAIDAPYPALLLDAGFRGIEEHDVTAEFIATLDALVVEWDEHAREMATILDAEVVTERQQQRRRASAAAGAGHMRRLMLIAETPAR